MPKQKPNIPKLVARSFRNPAGDDYDYSNGHGDIAYQIHHFKRTKVFQVRVSGAGWSSMYGDDLKLSDIFSPSCKVEGVTIHGFNSPTMFLLWALNEKINFEKLKYGDVVKDFFDKLI